MLSLSQQCLRHSRCHFIGAAVPVKLRHVVPAVNAFSSRRQLHLSSSHSQLRCRINQTVLSSSQWKLQSPFMLATVPQIRYASTDTPTTMSEASAAATTATETIGTSGKTLVDLTNLPPAPVPPTPVEEVATQVLNAAGEPTFASIGLGGWTPVGIVQQCMEFLHIGLDMPWWAAIALGTVCVRTLLFPLVILAQRNAAKMNNHLPEMQQLQLKLSEARQMGNALDASRYAQEMMLFMKEKEMNPLKNMIVPLAQAPLFISFFMGLRQMANAPVESMRDGGLFWFTDLTVSDPYFLLPVITCATLYLTIEVGTDSARMTAQNMATMRYVLRALPVVILPFMVNFPAAILSYWACSNFISLAQVAVLRIPKVRTYFRIDQLVKHKTETLPVKPKGFVGGIKDSWQNMKITRELQERSRLDEIRFERAGKGPMIKTYKYDPTKPRPPPTGAGAPMEAKKKIT